MIPTQLEDLLLIKQLKEGNAKAFEAVYKKYFKVLSVYGKSYVNDLDTAQDVVQEVFLKLYNRRTRIEIKTSLKSYLYQSVRNQCLDRLKQLKNQEKQYDLIRNATVFLDNEEEEMQIALLEKQEKLYNAIRQLPDQNQYIFKLSRFQGWTTQEIAEELQLSKRTVETHISNALKRLKTILYLIFIILKINIL